MTIDDVIAAVEEQTGKSVTPEAEVQKLVDDSLDFVDLILYVSNKCGDIPDSVVPRINTVNDLFLAAKGEL
jgi:acyl carrier protein